MYGRASDLACSVVVASGCREEPKIARRRGNEHDDAPSFERLEQGDLPLEEALKQFERGVALTRACQSALKAAEQKVEILRKASNTPGSPDDIEEFEPES